MPSRVLSIGDPFRYALFLAALLGGAGCGSNNGTNGGSTSTGSGGSTGSAGTGGLPYSGEVSMVHSGVTGGSFYISAGFSPTMAAGAPCAGGPQVGSCCYQGPSDGGSSPAPTAESAGPVAINDGSSALATLTFTDAGSYSVASSGQLAWTSGDTLSVSAAGATVDEFSGSITVPNAVSGLSPALSSSSPPGVPVSMDLHVSWTPDTTAGESFDIALIDGAKGVIHCYTTDAAASLTVSSSLLSHFSSGDSVTLGVARSGAATPTCANASVQLTAEATSSRFRRGTPRTSS